jgi:hypothetical protein
VKPQEDNEMRANEQLNNENLVNNFYENNFERQSIKQNPSFSVQLILAVLTIAGIVLLMNGAAKAQEAKVHGYGSVNELRGVRQIYVNAGNDFNARNQIIEEISKRLPQLQIVGDSEESDVTLVYRSELLQVADKFQPAPRIISSDSRTKNYYGETSLTDFGIQTVSVISGIGYVVKIDGDDTSRMLMSFQSERLPGSLERSPAVKFAGAFVKAHRRANAGLL